MDTIPGDQRTMNDNITQSTISRFACRILIDRDPPYTARIYAAGFDSGRNIFMGVSINCVFILWHYGYIVSGRWVAPATIQTLFYYITMRAMVHFRL